MNFTQEVKDELEAKGFYQAEGLAILNDIVVVEITLPFNVIRAMKLRTQESVDVFNKEMNDSSWAILRQYQDNEVMNG